MSNHNYKLTEEVFMVVTVVVTMHVNQKNMQKHFCVTMSLQKLNVIFVIINKTTDYTIKKNVCIYYNTCMLQYIRKNKLLFTNYIFYPRVSLY